MAQNSFGCSCPAYRHTTDLTPQQAFGALWRSAKVQIKKVGANQWLAWTDNPQTPHHVTRAEGPGGFCKHILKVMLAEGLFIPAGWVMAAGKEAAIEIEEVKELSRALARELKKYERRNTKLSQSMTSLREFVKKMSISESGPFILWVRKGSDGAPPPDRPWDEWDELLAHYTEERYKDDEPKPPEGVEEEDYESPPPEYEEFPF